MIRATSAIVRRLFIYGRATRHKTTSKLSSANGKISPFERANFALSEKSFSEKISFRNLSDFGGDVNADAKSVRLFEKRKKLLSRAAADIENSFDVQIFDRINNKKRLAASRFS